MAYRIARIPVTYRVKVAFVVTSDKTRRTLCIVFSAHRVACYKAVEIYSIRRPKDYRDVSRRSVSVPGCQLFRFTMCSKHRDFTESVKNHAYALLGF